MRAGKSFAAQVAKVACITPSAISSAGLHIFCSPLGNQ